MLGAKDLFSSSFFPLRRVERHSERTQINNKVLRDDKNHRLVIHRKRPGARISLMQKVESKERNIIKVHRSRINISVVPKAIKPTVLLGGRVEGVVGDGRDAVWLK